MSVAARTGRSVADLRARYEVHLVEGRGPEKSVGNIYRGCAISTEVQWFEDGLRFLGLLRPLAGAHFETLNERGLHKKSLLASKR